MKKILLSVAGLVFLFACSRQGFDSADSILQIQQADRTGPLGDVAMLVGESLELRTVLVDPYGDFVEEAPAVWLMVGSVFSELDLQWEMPASSSAVFRPSRMGTTVIHASYAGSNPEVESPSATTGLIQAQPASQATRVVMVSGDEQVGIVEQELAQPLQVQVLDQLDEPVAGADMVFTVALGDGAILGDERPAADADGQAGVRVRLGTQAGERNQMFRAALADDESMFVDFVASAGPGAADHLRFLVQPTQAVATAPFAEQPVVLMEDRFGNLTPSGATVSLSVAVGGGSLTGTTQLAMQSGTADFDDVAYDQVENAVVLRATGGGFQVDTDPFDVEDLPPGLCITQDAHFRTAGGGCTDLATGLSWSRKSPDIISWSALIWDSQRNNSSQPDEWDFGRTNDYPEDSGTHCGGNYCDTSSTGYCHLLTEGGRSDWRVPTRSELITLAANLIAGNPPYLQGQTDELIWSSSGTGNTSKYVINLQDGTETTEGQSADFLYAFCVRGDAREPADHLAVVSGPEQVGAGHPAPEMVVAVREPDGSQVNLEGLSVHLTLASAGNLGGSTEALTDAAGRAYLSGWTIDTEGQATLTVSADGLASATHSMSIGSFPHTCAIEDELFQTAEGGCKHLVSGLVWSYTAPYLQTWNEAVWDSENPVGNTPPDEFDGGRTNDYGNDPKGVVDNSLHNYCHELEEGGYHDWRLPTYSELHVVWAFGDGSATHFGFDTDREFMSSTTDYTDYRIEGINLTTGENTAPHKTSLLDALCVRQGS